MWVNGEWSISHMSLLIDKYLPEFTYNEYHERVIKASGPKCFYSAKNLDMSRPAISRMLFKIRGLPTNDLSLQGFIKNVCFNYLEEAAYNEFVIEASQPGIKIIWNFYFHEIDKNETLVSTETRILCLTRKTRFRFSIYWFFVKPFSGITRFEILRLIKRSAEKPSIVID